MHGMMQIDKSSDRSTDGWRDVDIEIIMPDSQMCVSVRSQEWNSTWLLFCMTSDTLSHSCHAFSPQGGEWGEERWSIDKKPCNTHWAITCVWDHTSALCRSVYLCTYTHTHTHTHFDPISYFGENKNKIRPAVRCQNTYTSLYLSPQKLSHVYS